MPLPAAVPPPDQFQLPDVNRLEPMPSLPAWVGLRIAALQNEVQRNPKSGKHEEMAVLPVNLILTEGEKADVLRHAEDLRALCISKPQESSEAEDMLIRELTKFLSFVPSQAQNELSAEARGEAFIDALSDLPVWAVSRAIKRFHRSDWGLDSQGKAYGYRWCPSPGELRSVAYREWLLVENRAKQLERLVSAAPLQEFSEEHRVTMLEKFIELQKLLATSLVGKDGSGEAAGRKPVDAYCGTRPKAKPGLKREGGRRRGGKRRK